MTTQTLNAAENPALANKIAQEITKVQVEETVGSVPTITIPSLPDTNIELPGGFYDPLDDQLVTTAEVRELTGGDEEAIVKISEPGKALMTILEKATVSLGGKPADKETLSMLLAGDREALLLAIRRVTFGNEVELEAVCSRCPELQTFVVDLEKDVEVKSLDDRINDRRFTLDLKVGKVKVALPTGDTQNKLVNASNKNTAELDTLLLSNCVLEINDVPVLGQAQIRNLGIKDRRTILEEIAKRNPGPLLSEVKKACKTCGQEVELPLTLADLFRS
jgi:dsDNA-binding SOS-regulon protein